jgi:DNA-binding CsgD family transcriptional regulator
MRRGRPKHPDILTPREWEVLSLLREGLTNPQIADRLGISENGVKYHVLEILTKLGVSTRYEAAAWERPPVPAARRYVALLPALLALRPPSMSGFSVLATKAGAVLLVATVVGFLGFIATGLLIMDQRA